VIRAFLEKILGYKENSEERKLRMKGEEYLPAIWARLAPKYFKDRAYRASENKSD